MTKAEKKYVLMAVKSLVFVKQPSGFYDNATLEIDPHWEIALEKMLNDLVD